MYLLSKIICLILESTLSFLNFDMADFMTPTRLKDFRDSLAKEWEEVGVEGGCEVS
jgi:hypothetical protein